MKLELLHVCNWGVMAHESDESTPQCRTVTVTDYLFKQHIIKENEWGNA
jgi:hypothetical protein